VEQVEEPIVVRRTTRARRRPNRARSRRT
jgi:hypothetical protein